ncbi:MAG: hypothetical protein AABO57_17475 [Acidobacteriota bacterium]
MRITILPLLLVALAASAREPTSKNVDLGKQFSIKTGQQVVVRGEKLCILFKSVSDDSRCPTGVQCVWAGNAAIEIEVSKKNAPTVATLNTFSEPKEIDYKGFKIRLVALNPYPKIDQKIDPKRYEASLIVTKNE